MPLNQYKIGLITRPVLDIDGRKTHHEIFLSLTDPEGIRAEERTGVRCKPGELTHNGCLGYRWEAAGRLNARIVQVKRKMIFWACLEDLEFVSVIDILHDMSSAPYENVEDQYHEMFEIPAIRDLRDLE